MEKERRVKEYCLWSLKFKYFYKWKRYLEELKKEKAREKRRKEMRLIVVVFLSDYEGFNKKSYNLDE